MGRVYKFRRLLSSEMPEKANYFLSNMKSTLRQWLPTKDAFTFESDFLKFASAHFHVKIPACKFKGNGKICQNSTVGTFVISSDFKKLVSLKSLRSCKAEIRY